MQTCTEIRADCAAAGSSHTAKVLWQDRSALACIIVVLLQVIVCSATLRLSEIYFAALTFPRYQPVCRKAAGQAGTHGPRCAMCPAPT